MGLRLPKMYHWGIRFPKTVLIGAFLLTVLSFVGAKKLRVINDFTSLLPEETESVRSLHELKDHFGGTGFLIVAVEAATPDLARGFADEFARRAEGHPSVLYVDYRRPVDYFKKRQWLYFDLKDLREMERRVDRALELQKKGGSPVFSSLMDFADEEDAPDLGFDDIFEKYRKKTGWQSEEVVSADEGKFVVLRIKARENPQDIDAGRALMNDFRKIEEELKQEEAYRPVVVGYTGHYQKAVEQADRTTREMAWVSAIVTVLLFLVLFVYFRRVTAVLLVGVPLAAGVIWTGGLVSLLLGHLNIITGFAAAILAGLGSDYGIFLLNRYYYERRAGRDFATACHEAFSNTGRATLASMVTTLGAFVALLFSDFRLFVEFGLVGSLGVLANYVVMMLILPSLLALLESRRLQPAPVRLPYVTVLKKFFTVRWAPAAICLVLFLCILSSLSLPAQSKIDYQDGLFENKSLPSYRLSDRVTQLMNVSLSPTLLMMKGREEEKRTVESLEGLLKGPSADSLVFNQVIGLSSFIPEFQTEKKAILAGIYEKFKKVQLPSRAKMLASLRDSLEAGPIERGNLPPEVVRMFEAPGGDVYTVYLYPSFFRSSSEKLKRYHEGVLAVKRELGLHFIAADSTFVSDDTVRLIEREAPRGMLVLLVFLAGVALVVLRPLKRAVILLANLIGSLVLLSGLLWAAHIPLNVLNIAVIPIILGTGIDCFVHFSHRFDEIGDLSETLRLEIRPIFISSLTSIIGFGGLILTSSEGLRSTGWVAVLGLSLVTLICAFVFPRCLVFESLEGLFKLQNGGVQPGFLFPADPDVGMNEVEKK